MFDQRPQHPLTLVTKLVHNLRLRGQPEDAQEAFNACKHILENNKTNNKEILEKLQKLATNQGY